MLTDSAIENAILRFAVLLGAILCAGSILFAVTFRHTSPAVGSVLTKQILFGAGLIIVVEPLRWFILQLAMSGGDFSVAFDPGMRWLALEMPQGQAALVRIIGVLFIATLGLRAISVGVIGVMLVLGSFVLEGHTAAMATGTPWLSVLLLAHLVAVSWWLGSLWPLSWATKELSGDEAVSTVERFGGIAFGAFLVLGVAGVSMFIALTSGSIDPDSPYQRFILAKLVVVTAILGIAAYNKLVLTPGFRTAPETAKQALRNSIRYEIALAAIVLLLTGSLITMSPGKEH